MQYNCFCYQIIIYQLNLNVNSSSIIYSIPPKQFNSPNLTLILITVPQYYPLTIQTYTIILSTMEKSNNNHTEDYINNKDTVECDEPPSAKPIAPPRKKAPFKIRRLTTIGFEKAQWQQAQKKCKEMSVMYFNDQKVPYNTHIDHFRIYGPGVYLFFSFVKKVILFFLILIFLSLIPTIYNAVVGERYTSIKDSLSKYLSILTIGNLRPYDQQYSSLADKLINTIPTFFVSLIFFWFYLFWSRRSEKESHKVKRSIKLESFKTVEVIQFPKDMTEDQLRTYMSVYGQVKKISPVRNYNDKIFYCRKIYEQALDGKQLILEREKKQIPSDDKFQKQIQKREKQLQKLHEKLEKQEANSEKQILKFFVTFQSPQQRDKAVETFMPYVERKSCCFKRQYPQQLRLRGQQVVVKACHTQPGGIIWQNVHVTWKTRWIRLLLQLILIVVVIFLGFCFILILNVLNPPITTSKIDSSAYNQTTIMTVEDKSVVRSWCLNNYDLVQSNPDSDYGQLCQEYMSSSASRILISIAIALGIMVIKYILKYTVLYLSKFMRYKTFTQQALEMTKNLFLTYFFSTVFITMFMQAKFDTFSPKQLVKYISSSQDILMNLKEMNDFRDFTNGWYLDVGYQIWITWFILAITYPVLILTYHYPLEWVCKLLAERQVLQRKMQKYLMPEEFQIADHYANLGLFIFVGIVFSPGMPSILILTGIGLVMRYFYFKFVFIRFSKIPKPFDESLNTLLLRLLVFGIFCHLILAIWMYGVTDLFDQEDSFIDHELYSQDDSDFEKFWLIVVKRGIDTWYLTGLLVFYTFYFFLWELMREIYFKCRGKKETFKAPPQMLKATVGNEGYIQGIQTERSLTKSYKIENNPEYFDILAIMQRRQLVSSIRPKIFT